jgi:hypothetical protein
LKATVIPESQKIFEAEDSDFSGQSTTFGLQCQWCRDDTFLP